ncbi:hypothetical protein RWA02_15520 [Sinorhizobium meliloti]|uniref:hypothetical protein n=1 Tax=Rhizobium meliloti TaxID=382 RepID=UPI00299DFBA3|nr:hypothetical protein [Sinorhizobium meliloti]MDW9997112.1 hypothetical protein [Sinorhizobium meliloti]
MHAQSSTITDLRAAENLVQAAIETCDDLRKLFDGSDAAKITRLKTGLRIAIDRIGDALDELDPDGRKGIAG